MLGNQEVYGLKFFFFLSVASWQLEIFSNRWKTMNRTITKFLSPTLKFIMKWFEICLYLLLGIWIWETTPKKASLLQELPSSKHNQLNKWWTCFWSVIGEEQLKLQMQIRHLQGVMQCSKSFSTKWVEPKIQPFRRF